MYQLATSPLGNSYVIRTNDDGSKTSIPESDKNADWQIYQDWLAEDPR